MLNRGQQFIMGSEALGVVHGYICSRQVVIAEPDLKSEITRRIGIGWSSFGRYSGLE